VLHDAIVLQSVPMMQYLLSKIPPSNLESLEGLDIVSLSWAENEPFFQTLIALIQTPMTVEDYPIKPLDILKVHKMLYGVLGLPKTMASRILDLAEYWVQVSVTRREAMSVTERSGECEYVSVVVRGRKQHPVRRIVFSTVSHDQGWSSNNDSKGTYRNSYTWFEAGVVQASSSYPRRIITHNIHASLEHRTHVRAWENTELFPELKKWLEQIVPGDRIVVYPRAQYAGWVNVVASVEIKLYCAYV